MPTKAPTHSPVRIAKRAVRGGKRRALETNSTQWRSIRAQQLALEPLCRICARNGLTTAANEVDHIDGDAFHEVAHNRQSLCKPCHSSKTATENGGFGSTDATDLIYPPNLKPSAIPLTILFGPPAAGKTTIGRSLKPTTLIDLDDYYDRGLSGLRDVMQARNADIRKLATARIGSAVFLVGAPTAKARTFWINALRPTRAVMVFADRTVCNARIRQRTGHKLERSIRGAESWWNQHDGGGDVETIRTDDGPRN